MKLGKELLKVLGKPYPPNDMVYQHFGRYDLAFKTDDQGRAVLLFIGKLGENGMIKGERYTRRLVLNKDGNVIRDHWDNKGKG